MLHRELLIGGNLIGGPCDQAVGKTVSRNPYTGATVGTAADASWAEARAAAEAARDAFGTWRYSSRKERAELLRSVAGQVEMRKEELADLLMQEVGKPIALARAEVARMGMTFSLAADLAAAANFETVDVSYDSRATRHRVGAKRFPIGPILGIVPYNWPYNLAAHKLAPAIASGNTIVLKGSELAPLSTLTLGQLIHEAGCPAGVVNVIQADARTSEKLAEWEGWAMISFTGSPSIGWMLKRKFPEKRVVLELGGDAYCFLFEDADLDDALPKVVQSAYAYAGQICISTQHIRIHSSLYEPAKEDLIRAVESVPFGDPSEEATLCGPLISQAAAEKVEQFVMEAVAGGARILAGGKRAGNRFEPTLVENVPPQCRLATEEVFGPVATVAPFESVDEAVAMVNRSAYGIHASAFTSDGSIVKRLYQEAEVGGVLINEPPTLRFDAMPYGGVKRSGFGREGVQYAIEEMSELKTLVTLEPQPPA